LITEKVVGFTNDDLLEVLKGQREVGNKYKTHFFAMFSQLFCTIAEEIISKFGDDGKEAIASSVKKFGEERGRRIAKLVRSLGKELTLKNFFIYSDLEGGETAKYKIKIVDGKVEIVIRECVFFNGCKEWDKLDYGIIYCEYIDKSIMKAYNPALKFEHSSLLTKGDNRCVQRYMVKEN